MSPSSLPSSLPSSPPSLKVLLAQGLVTLMMFLHLDCDLIDGGLKFGGDLPPPLLLLLLTKFTFLLNKTARWKKY